MNLGEVKPAEAVIVASNKGSIISDMSLPSPHFLISLFRVERLSNLTSGYANAPTIVVGGGMGYAGCAALVPRCLIINPQDKKVFT